MLIHTDALSTPSALALVADVLVAATAADCEYDDAPMCVHCGAGMRHGACMRSMWCGTPDDTLANILASVVRRY